jgi:hypothetical protein
VYYSHHQHLPIRVQCDHFSSVALRYVAIVHLLYGIILGCIQINVREKKASPCRGRCRRPAAQIDDGRPCRRQHYAAWCLDWQWGVSSVEEQGTLVNAGGLEVEENRGRRCLNVNMCPRPGRWAAATKLPDSASFATQPTPRPIWSPRILDPTADPRQLIAQSSHGSIGDWSSMGWHHDWTCQ